MSSIPLIACRLPRRRAVLDLVDLHQLYVRGHAVRAVLLRDVDDLRDCAWAVVHTAADITIAPRDVPSAIPDTGRFTAVGLSPHLELTFAPWESFLVESLGMTREELFAYADVLASGDAPIHRLLGHPDPVQGDMQVECQLVTNGLYCGDASGYQDPRAAQLRPGA